MADVQNIETTVRENNFLSVQKRGQVLEPPELHEPSSSSSAMAFMSSSYMTGRVPYFITTIPPA